jgi:SprT protein
MVDKMKAKTVYVSADIKNQVNAQITNTLEKAKVLFGYTEPFPVVNYDVRGTCAGKAWVTKNIIGFNSILLTENVEQFLKRTVVHEMAHVIAYKRYGSRGHDNAWKNVMIRLGADPSRCHSYDVSNARVKNANAPTYTYKCACHEREVTQTRHNKILKGANYTCRSCRQRITFVSKTEQKVVKIQPVIKPQLPSYTSPVQLPVAAQQSEPTTTKKVTNKQIVAEIIAKHPNATKAEWVDMIVARLQVTSSNAGVYLYNHFKK